METADREKLEQLALKQLDATAHDVERWSFLFRTEGAVDFLFCPWSVTEHWEFDGEVDDLGLPWSTERLDLIKSGEADPNEKELLQWREAKCRKLADGSDWCWIAWIVPVRVDNEIAGYAIFLLDLGGDLGGAPILQGAFESIENAMTALAAEGAVGTRGLTRCEGLS